MRRGASRRGRRRCSRERAPRETSRAEGGEAWVPRGGGCRAATLDALSDRTRRAASAVEDPSPGGESPAARERGRRRTSGALKGRARRETSPRGRRKAIESGAARREARSRATVRGPRCTREDRTAAETAHRDRGTTDRDTSCTRTSVRPRNPTRASPAPARVRDPRGSPGDRRGGLPHHPLKGRAAAIARPACAQHPASLERVGPVFFPTQMPIRPRTPAVFVRRAGSPRAL